MSEAMRTTVESCGIGGRHANRGVAKGQHAEDVVAIHHETTSGTSLFAWADEILTDAAGRITRAHLYSHGSGTYATASYRTDGRVDTFNVPRRTGSSTYVDAMDREYTYSLDGSSMGWATSCADDEDRTFLYDGANRLVCATDGRAPPPARAARALLCSRPSSTTRATRARATATRAAPRTTRSTAWP